MVNGIDITLIGSSGKHWPVHRGRSKSGRHPGITLAEGSVVGLMDAPIETDWVEDTSGGAVLAGERFVARDMTLGFFVSEELAGTPIGGQLESDFRREFTSRADRYDPNFRHPQVLVESDVSGPRRLTIQMREAPDMKMQQDPFTRRFFDLTYQVRAGQPLYLGDTGRAEFETDSPSGSGFVTVSNPTDVDIKQTWVLTRGLWTLPDPSWKGARGERVPGGEHGSRTLTLPMITESDQGVRLTREFNRKLHASTFTGTNFLPRMNGQWLLFDIPAYTRPTSLPISVTDAPAGGARAELLMPELWTRPV